MVEEGGEPGSSFVNTLIIMSLAICGPLLLALQSNMLAIWIMMVSLQLIAHLPLMNSMMPPNVIQFLR